jgi:RNA polymerase sigma-B factor
MHESRRAVDVVTARIRAIVGNQRTSRRDEERRALLRSYGRTRDPRERARLIEAYLPLVRALARRYAHSGERLDDLVQVGSIGLIEAIDRFEPDRGLDLGCFAVPTITGRIRNHLRDRSSTIRVPRRATELRSRLRPHREALSLRLSREPTLGELARAADMAEGDVEDAIATERACAVLPLPEEERVAEAVLGSAPREDAFDSSENRLLLAAGFRTLTERERRILHLRFYAGLSQAEIARELGLSQIHVSRLIRASLERMRGALSDRDDGRTSSRVAE